MRRRLTLIGLLLFLLLAGAAAVGWQGWTDIHEPYKGFDGAEQFVTVRQGASSAEIGRVLAGANIVREPRLFRGALWWTGEGRNLKAGEYRFDHPVTPLEVVDVLARGDVFERRLTIPEGLTIQEMSRLYESHGFGRARDFVEASRSVERIRDLDPHATDLEGYLFPETYALPKDASASRLIDAMVARFLVVFSEEIRTRAAAQMMTVRQVVTLASLIEKETAKPEERPIVAAVYRNRLTIGMPMQADPTVVYALAKMNRYDGNIRRDDLALDSPYNTYKHPGLPPGPIASPGQASLEAAVMPADAPYLYFVSRNDGSHTFATTLAEHNRNVQKFQVEFFRNQRLGRGQGAGGSGRSTVPPTSASRGASRNTRAPAP